LHFDLTENFLVVLRGTKRVLLFAPSESRHLYPFPVTAKTPHMSHVDPIAPDLAAFPDYAQARGVEVELAAGEMLYVPAFWWHHVRSYGLNIALNFWYLPALTAYGYLLRSAYHRRLAASEAKAFARRTWRSNPVATLVSKAVRVAK
jgi:hypothetical protein